MAYGIDLQPVFDEIHAANLSKGEPEVVRRPDGMLLKGAGYRPPQVARVVREQLGLTAAAS